MRSWMFALVWFIIVASVFTVACGGGGSTQREDKMMTEDTSAKQAAIDAANAAALEKAKKVNIAPQLQITAPPNGAAVTEAVLLVQWTAVDDSGAVPTVELSIRNIKSDSPTVIMPGTASTGSFTFNGFGSLPPGDYELQLKGTDGPGLSNVAFSRLMKS